MADNIAVTAGSGTIVGADDVSSVYYQRVKVSVGADGVAADGGTYKVSANFNRPADTNDYVVGDAIANSTTAGSVTPMSFAITGQKGIVRRVRIKKSDQTIATPTIRVWLFDASPAPGAGDNAAFTAPLANCVGFVDVAVTSAGSDDAVGFEDCDVPVTVATVYGLLQTQTAYDCANASAETYDVTLWYLAG